MENIWKDMLEDTLSGLTNHVAKCQVPQSLNLYHGRFMLLFRVKAPLKINSFTTNHVTCYQLCT